MSLACLWREMAKGLTLVESVYGEGNNKTGNAASAKGVLSDTNSATEQLRWTGAITVSRSRNQ